MENQYLIIPNEILGLKDLNGDDKLMLALICYYDNGKGCIASNQYFANMFGYSKTSASERITKLKKLGYIQTSSYTYNNKTFRKIIPIDWSDKLKEIVGLVEEGIRES